MQMTTLNISLPDDVRELADRLVSSGRYASVSDYVASLIREDIERLERSGVEAKLLQRLAAGPSGAMSDADFDTIRGRVEREITRRREP
jgi:antitoxin ParD1/3/4